LADKQSGRPSGSLSSNTQPKLKGSSSKPYQPPQARNEHVNAVFMRSVKSYDLPTNPNDQQNDSENPVNFDSDDEDEELTPQPKSQTPKPINETPIPKPYKPKISYPKCLRKEIWKPNMFLKELVSKKHKLEQISFAFLSDESSAMIQNKFPPKYRDPRSFLIQCNFSKVFLCNALADLGASIRLAVISFQHPIGIVENMLVEVGKFIFPVDFVILEIEKDSKVPLILGRPFLHTADAVIRVKQKQLNLGVGTERMTFYVDSAMKHSYSIDGTILEDFDALLDKGSNILHSIDGTILEEKLFAEFDEFMAMTADEHSE
ncbi:reverse transcriptase domain-containing protein, partial [Tanacetum coccineum]